MNKTLTLEQVVRVMAQATRAVPVREHRPCPYADRLNELRVLAQRALAAHAAPSTVALEGGRE